MKFVAYAAGTWIAFSMAWVLAAEIRHATVGTDPRIPIAVQVGDLLGTLLAIVYMVVTLVGAR